jgi:hypothetical protein
MRTVFPNPFEAEGSWFKGNLHTHTDNSDGEMTREVAVSRYRAAGYDFLSITDHGRLTPTLGLSTSEFLLIPGEEVCVGATRLGRYFHIVGLNIEAPLPMEDFDRDITPQRALDLISEQGGEGLVAHPHWSELTDSDLIDLKGHLGIEVYNANCDLTIERGFSSIHWDNLLSSGKRVMGLAVDDAHGREKHLLPSDWCRAWIQVRAPSLTAEDIMSSIRKGLFYSSTGPEIKNVVVDEDEIRVETSPVRSVSFVSNTALGAKRTGEGSPLGGASYQLRGGERYLRIEVTDDKGRKAWTNPIFFEA